MLAAFLIICCCFSFIRAIDTDSLLITGGKKNLDLYIHNDSEFTIYLQTYVKRASWVLENVEDLNNFNIEPLNLVHSAWTGKNNTAKLDTLSSDYNNSLMVFKFRVNDLSVENLPRLNFLYKEDENISVTVNLLPSQTEKVDIKSLDDPILNYNKDEYKIVNQKLGDNLVPFKVYKKQEYNNAYIRNYESKTLRVDSNSIHMVVIEGDYVRDLSLNSKAWYLENENEIESNKAIELISTASRFEGNTSQYIFIFKINELGKDDILPILLFSRKDSKEDAPSNINCSVLLLNQNEPVCSINDVKSISKCVMEKNETFVVLIYDEPTSGYYWYLKNEEEIKSSDSIEYIPLMDDGKVPFYPYGIKSGSKGYYFFKFKVKESAQGGPLPSTLKFIKADQTNEILSTAEVSLMVKEKDLPELLYDGNGKIEVNVESNTVLEFTVDDHPFYVYK